jgi:hypothetical protein
MQRSWNILEKQKFHSKTDIPWQQLARASLNTYDLSKEYLTLFMRTLKETKGTSHKSATPFYRLKERELFNNPGYSSGWKCPFCQGCNWCDRKSGNEVVSWGIPEWVSASGQAALASLLLCLAVRSYRPPPAPAFPSTTGKWYMALARSLCPCPPDATRTLTRSKTQIARQEDFN